MRVGIIGGGQLGRMLAMAAVPLGTDIRSLDPSADAPAGRVSELIVAAYDDRDALARLAEGCDVVTYEFENVPVAAAEWLAGRVPLCPPPLALQVAQDRLTEKRFFNSHEVETPRFVPVDSLEELRAGLNEIGTPAVLKTRRLGYDGKGQVRLAAVAEAEQAWAALGGSSLILEAMVPFEREVSVIAARSASGAVVVYPLVENLHRGGILRRSLAPAPGTSAALTGEAHVIAQRILVALDYVGVLAIELFQVGGKLLANEMAPRVHNSGHWTIEGAVTSQFENHLRAILGLPLGLADPRGQSAMLNLIGTLPPSEEILRVPGAHLHLYQKAPRAGRKLGHVTLTADGEATLRERLGALEPLLP